MSSDVSEISELEFSDFWSNSGVNKEVLRGVKLRQEKIKYLSKECIPVDITTSTAAVKNIHYNSRNKKNKTGLCQGAILSCYQSPLSSTLSTCYKNKRRRKCPLKGPRSKKSKCPLRIAQLAVPTKRQCLDTWRNRGKTLPNFMVDRLRQHVMDQKPVVNIHDAIDCFKSRRIKMPRTTKTRKSKSENKNFARAKLFCALFAQKITMKLLPSGPIHTNLRNLSDIINEEITQLLRNGKKIYVRNKYMQNEISDKVAVWIATILEDSYMKLMMDDLKDLEEEEGHVWDIIDELVETVLESSKSKSILNIENQSQKISKSSSFISIYSNQSIHSDNKASKNDEHTELFDELQDDTKVSLQSHETKTEMIELILSDIVHGVGDTQSLEEFIKSVLDDALPEAIINDSNKNNRTDIIKESSGTHDDFEPKKNSVIILIDQKQSPIVNKQLRTINDDDTKHNSISKSEEMSMAIEDSTQKLCITESKSNIDIEHKIIDDNKNDKIKEEITFILEERLKYIENVENNLGTSMDYEDNNVKLVNSMTAKGQQFVPKDQTELHIESVSTVANHYTNNQTEVELYNYQENAIEEPPDDSFKKVKFSDINIGNDRRIMDADNNQRSVAGNIILDKTLPSSSSGNNFKHINFSPPNSHLLYDVDESWPDDFLPLTNKLSASVSKSVTSLGFIKEADEKVTSPPGVKQDREISNHCVDKKFMAKLSNSCNEPTNNTKDLQEALFVKIQNLNKTKENEGLQCNHNILDISFDNHSLEMKDYKTDLKIVKDAITSCINIKLKSEILPSINVDSETLKMSYKGSFTNEKQTQTENAKRTVKMQYSSCIMRQQQKRIWCEGLTNVVLNLEKWLKWIEYTHKLVAKLRKNDTNENIFKTPTIHEDYMRNWMKLKNCIDFDAKIWRNMYQCLRIGLKGYNNYHTDHNIKSTCLQGSCLCQKTF